jgi:branched-subunit amino acid transport protein AzlD
MLALDMFDFWVGSVLIFILALIQSVIYGWLFGIERGEREAHIGAHMRIPRFIQYMLKYVVPVYLLTILVAFCWEKLPSREVEGVYKEGYIEMIATNRVALLSAVFLGSILMFLLLLVRIAGKRWEAQGRFTDLG